MCRFLVVIKPIFGYFLKVGLMGLRDIGKETLTGQPPDRYNNIEFRAQFSHT
jgi:hypothetical protein